MATTVTTYEVQTIKFGEGRFVTQLSTKDLKHAVAVHGSYARQPEVYPFVRVHKVETTVTELDMDQL